ncbi:MAG: hypothetical protein Q9190_005218 [Brigantiaea leucoxantha]
MNNVPNVQLQQIINQLNQLTDNFNQRMDRLERRFDGLETKFEHQSVFEHNNVKVYDVNINSNQNSMARLQNHHASSPTDALTPLVNLATGQDIPNFPADSNSITRLTAPQVRGILQELGQRLPDNPGVVASRRLLRIQIGLQADQVSRA